MSELENITRGIGELDFFDNIGFVRLFELDHITRGNRELAFFDNIGFV
jgi:hypothetical protein